MTFRGDQKTRILIWLVAITGFLVAVGYVWYTRHPTAAGILKGRTRLASGEIEALQKLLSGAGLDPRGVRVVDVDPEIPCWSHDYRNWLDHRLGVYRRFGRFGDNCIGIDGNQVVSISLVETRLADMTPLSHFPRLRQLQLRDSRIERIEGIPEDCRWTWLVLSQNRVTDLSPVMGCSHIETLDVSFNQLERLPNLHQLGRLQRLDVRKNRLIDVSGLTGHPSLVRLDLTANRLTNVEGLARMPWLESLHLGSNGLSSLAGLEDLPALKILFAHSNRLQEVEAELTAGLPSLRHANLDGNPLSVLPPGYKLREGPGRIVIEPEDGTIPQIEINHTPLADALVGEPRE